MLHSAIEAFLTQDAALARRAMEVEELIDRLRHQLNADLVGLQQQGKIPLQALSPLMTIVNRFERVGDQAKSICQEVLYMCTGEYHKHSGSDIYRLLFVDEHNSCRSQMAEAIGNSLGQPKFVFASAGLDATVDRSGHRDLLEGTGPGHLAPDLQGTGPDSAPRPLPDHRGPRPGGATGFPPAAHEGGLPGLGVRDPSTVSGTPAEMRAAYQETYDFLAAHVQDLVEAVLGDSVD